MTPTYSSTPLVVRGPDSLPALIPHLVGFHPRESLVLVGLDSRERTVLVTLRVDLPGVDMVVGVAMEGWAPLITALQAAGAIDVLAVVYPGVGENPWRDHPCEDLPRRSLLAALADRLSGSGLVVLDALCVVGDRLRSYWCADPDCCPREGRLVDGAETLRVQAHLIAEGSAPLASRDMLVSALAPRAQDDPVADRIARSRDGVVLRLPVGTVARVGIFVSGMRDWGNERRNPATMTRLVILAEFLAGSIRSRDLLLHALTVDGDRNLLAAAREVFGEAVRCAHGDTLAPVASVLAVCCWIDGDGAAARVALDRATSADVDYPLATLVSAALDRGMPPRTWISLMGEMCVADILGDEADGPTNSCAS